MLDNMGRFILRDYMHKEPFCSFLPGVAGVRGIPMWCYYVNRGQCISSFGVQDKDHAIMEFFPAHQAYQYTHLVGFRTFMRIGGEVIEPFGGMDGERSMIVDMNELIIEERRRGMTIRVRYNTLPEERVAALMRRVEIVNEGSEPLEIELLDGMPAVIPCGVNLYAVKEMTQTAKAWMQAEERDSGVMFYRVRASMQDTSDVQEVKGVNFAMAVTEAGDRLPICAQARHVFGQDTGLVKPLGFINSGFADFMAQREVRVNGVPCCFFARRLRLAPGEKAHHTALFGQAESEQTALCACARLGRDAALEQKAEEARALARALTDGIETKTGDPVFDAYCRQTMLDNLLRGGAPVRLQGGRTAYLYSRKHGDPERDYNAFSLRAEYASQGNGNFRDVNQNRRCDVLFAPFVGERNVRMFYSLIQADGYNPLVIQYVTYTLDAGDRVELCAMVSPEDREQARAFFSRAFTAGELMMAAQTWRYMPGSGEEKLLAQAFREAQEDVSASFGEGYWSDHWTYNLDQIESYLSVYPEKEAELLYAGKMTWYASPVRVLPRAQRYVKTERGVRQYRSLEKAPRAADHLLDVQGRAVTAVLMEKLLVLCALKTATLDPFGMGVEMEGGKPGWYDALNGLPGLLGSSMPETLELLRMLDYVSGASARFGCSVCVMSEAAQMMRECADALEALRGVWEKEACILPVWERLNDVREAYREKLEAGVSGRRETLDAKEIASLLDVYAQFVRRGIEKALEHGGGLCPTYFACDVTDFVQDDSGMHPKAFALRRMPDFLEGQVRYLRLKLEETEKQRLIRAVRESRLYDKKLSMYKVNAALSQAGYEIGRAHAFTPGWLENESIWLHMEYKYLLELLRSHQYADFIGDFHRAAVPFMDSAVYGRSPLENSSFIASSANPDESIHGKGFVARLSGSTAEFMSIWQIMLLGEKLFEMKDGELSFVLSPLLPSYLTRGCETVEATLLGKTKVVYHIAPGVQYVPGGYEVSMMEVAWDYGGSLVTTDCVLRGEDALHVREGRAKRIELWLEA